MISDSAKPAEPTMIVSSSPEVLLPDSSGSPDEHAARERIAPVARIPAAMRPRREVNIEIPYCVGVFQADYPAAVGATVARVDFRCIRRGLDVRIARTPAGTVSR